MKSEVIDISIITNLIISIIIVNMSTLQSNSTLESNLNENMSSDDVESAFRERFENMYENMYADDIESEYREYIRCTLYKKSLLTLK